MTEYFNRVAKDKKLRIKRVYWYTWFSGYTPARSFNNIPTFQYAGLTRAHAVGKPFHKKPLLSAYARIAAKLQGCRKTDDARTCAAGSPRAELSRARVRRASRSAPDRSRSPGSARLERRLGAGPRRGRAAAQASDADRVARAERGRAPAAGPAAQHQPARAAPA